MDKSTESKMTENESLFRLFWNDLINVKLIKTKFIWFTTLFGVVVLWPFFSLHMTQIGLSERDVGIVTSMSAVLTIIGPFMWGFIADKMGNFKLLVSGFTFMTGVTCLLFTVIPSASTSTSITISNSTTNETLSQQNNDNYAITFWSYIIVRGMFSIAQGGSFTLYEGAVMCHMQDKGIDYGMQRAWGTLAVGISPFIGGILKDIYGMQVLFYLAAAFFFITAAALLFFELQFKKSAKGLSQEILTQLINPEIIMLMLSFIAVGAIKGYTESYFYIYLTGMGANNTLLGLTITVGVPFEIIMQFCATAIVGKIGHVNAILIGILSNFFRLLGLSFLTNPWWVLPFAVLKALIGGLFMTAALMYCTSLVTLTSLASFRGLIGVASSGIGQFLGASIGTIIRENLGDRATFMIWSQIALATTMIYFISYQILLKYRKHNRYGKSTIDKETEKGIDNPAWIDN